MLKILSRKSRRFTVCLWTVWWSQKCPTKKKDVVSIFDFSDCVDPLICDGPCIEFVGIIAWSINQIPSLVFSSETQPTGKYEFSTHTL